MVTRHVYRATVRWTGNLGNGTKDYGSYSRDHAIEVAGKASILGSAGLSPRSDAGRHNPEELVAAALSSCHMLWYLHLCSEAGVTVSAYTDAAEVVLELEPDGFGRITGAILRPRVVLAEGSPQVARRLHEEAHRKCFVAKSVNFPVVLRPVIEREGPRLEPA